MLAIPAVMELMLALALLGCGSPVPQDRSVRASPYEMVPPQGYVGFCARHLKECPNVVEVRPPVVMSATDWTWVEDINKTENQAILPRPDSVTEAEDWDYVGKSNRGNCIQYALAKRRMLLESGFPPSDVLLATATTENGEYHLVVILVTAQAPVVLDNRDDAVIVWDLMPYKWISMQKPGNPNVWLAFDWGSK